MSSASFCQLQQFLGFISSRVVYTLYPNLHPAKPHPINVHFATQHPDNPNHVNLYPATLHHTNKHPATLHHAVKLCILIFYFFISKNVVDFSSRRCLCIVYGRTLQCQRLVRVRGKDGAVSFMTSSGQRSLHLFDIESKERLEREWVD